MTLPKKNPDERIIFDDQDGKPVKVYFSHRNYRTAAGIPSGDSL